MFLQPCVKGWVRAGGRCMWVSLLSVFLVLPGCDSATVGLEAVQLLSVWCVWCVGVCVGVCGCVWVCGWVCVCVCVGVCGVCGCGCVGGCGCT